MEHIELDPNFPTETIRKIEIKPLIPWGWLRAALYFIASLLATMIGQIFAIAIILAIRGITFTDVISDSFELDDILSDGEHALLSLFGLFMLLLITWIFRKFIDHKSFISLGFQFRGYTKDLLWGLLWGAALIVFGTITLVATGNLTIIEIRFEYIPLLQSLSLFILVAFNEEIMFRGYILSNLNESMNKYLALFVSAIIFMVLHSMNPNFSAMGALNIFLAGLVLGIYYIHKQNLWFPIGMHFTWNYFQGPVFGYEVSGQTTTNSIIVQELQGNELLTGGDFGLEGSLLASLGVAIIILIIHLQYREKKDKAAA